MFDLSTILDSKLSKVMGSKKRGAYFATITPTIGSNHVDDIKSAFIAKVGFDGLHSLSVYENSSANVTFSEPYQFTDLANLAK